MQILRGNRMTFLIHSKVLLEVKSGLLLEIKDGKAFRVVGPGEFVSIDCQELKGLEDSQVDRFDDEERLIRALLSENDYLKSLIHMRSKPIISKAASAILQFEGIDLPRQDMADVLCTSKEGLTRAIADLRDEGLIELERLGDRGNRKKIRILDRNKLSTISRVEKF